VVEEEMVADAELDFRWSAEERVPRRLVRLWPRLRLDDFLLASSSSSLGWLRDRRGGGVVVGGENLLWSGSGL